MQGDTRPTDHVGARIAARIDAARARLGRPLSTDEMRAIVTDAGGTYVEHADLDSAGFGVRPDDPPISEYTLDELSVVRDRREWSASPFRNFGLWLWLVAPCWLVGHRHLPIQGPHCANCGVRVA